MLTVRARMVLELADTRYRYAGAKVTAMRELVGYSEPHFWARVETLLEDAEAEAEMPAEVHRLRRLRERRAAARGVSRN